MTAFRIRPHDPAVQRAPRIRDKKHLAYVSELPCVITGRWPVEVAHVRFPSAAHGKPHTGMQEKPDDKWTVPLTREMHREGEHAQHNGNEHAFWHDHGIDVLGLCEELYQATGDLDRMRQIIQTHREGRTHEKATTPD